VRRPSSFHEQNEQEDTMATGLSRAIAAGIKSKVSLAVLAGLLATAGATGVAAAAASNGAFGQQVKEQVQDCKAQLASGTHGIGDCVSDFAQQHGAQQRQQHSQGKPSSTPDTHGKSDAQHGKSDAQHGKSDAQHGKPPTPTPNGHGKP
jgi:hypothetical protein